MYCILQVDMNGWKVSVCARIIPGGAGGAGGGGGGGMVEACVAKLMLSAMAATTLSARFFSSATSSHPLCWSMTTISHEDR